MANMDADRSRLELRRILDQCLACTARLEDLLHDERSALELQDSDKLRAVTTSKETCVQCLDGLDTERQSLCAAAGYDGNEAGMKVFLGWCDRNDLLTSIWNRLLHSAKQCDALNRTNGAIGRVRYEHVMSALAVLSGEDADTQLYSPEGQDTARLAQRALARV